jgi:hypothetical protein
MAMIESVIQINPATGTVITSTGAAGAVFDAMDATQDYGTLPAVNPPAYAATREQIANLARAVAKIVPYIQTSAVVSTTVASGIAVSVDPVTHDGSTTAAGSGTGTVG